MAKRKNKNLEFANFICKFGDEKNLLDLAIDIVIPAFISPELERPITDARYFFIETQVIELEPILGSEFPTFAIIGRFVKDTTLSREQIFDGANRRLVTDIRQIKSAPSSLFVLLLNTHKLLFVRETKNAPGIASFETTIKYFLKVKHQEFIRRILSADEEGLLSGRDLLEQYPKPTIEVIPLATGGTLEDFIERFSTLENVRIKLVKPNNDLDNNDFFPLFRQSGDDLNSKNTVLEYENKEEGLIKEAAVVKLRDAVQQGNSRISFVGKDSQGEVLKGNNDKFKVYVPLSSIPENIIEAANQMFNKFQNYVNRERLHFGRSEEDTSEQLGHLQDYLRQRDGETQ